MKFRRKKKHIEFKPDKPEDYYRGILHNITEEESEIIDQIRNLQIARLRKTYQDYFENPEYTQISKYFFERVYGGEDKTSRDAAFNKIYEKLSAAVNEKRIVRVSQLKQLNELTDELDLQMARLWVQKKNQPSMTLVDFENCYREMNERSKRELQLQLLMETTRFFHRLSHIPFIGFVIKPTQFAARALGVEYVMDFFLDGYKSFKSVKNAEPFMQAIQEREWAYMEKVFNSENAL